ncbi:MarR family winged helix-turn-helix transcriptional regulator [Ammoniphilus sp. CFH 90114]|uniref:MarR family winged helix-turn-helix transcriptional regulator n=1 Tax=Ammoniphilus sp. CFH 90114 TaxID=2493665 RepID=UPI00100E7C58|nr:MarR family transcriptional regulator [Ammoniphilus sp. CFH 90114]RXT15505.1 MarR family transcriptional regulator [Ammoniphilus sp. CFH 90114]
MQDRIQQLHEALNMLRAISVVNKDDWEAAAKRLNLDSAVQLNILWIVYCYEGVRVTQIADWTFWHPSSVVIHVKKMMEKDLITIEKSDKDGRVVNVYLTDLGKKIVEDSRVQALENFHFTKALESFRERYGPNVMNLFFECLSFLAQELHGEEKIKWIKESEEKVREIS